MDQGELLRAAYLLLAAVAGGVYYAVGNTILRRAPEGAGRLAAQSFAFWWMGLAVLQVGGVATSLAHMAHILGLPAYLAYLQFILLLLAAMLAALVYYFVYLFTGKRASWKWIGGMYGAYWVLLVYYVALSEPIGLTTTATGVQVEYGQDLDQSAWGAIIAITLLLPPILGALGYFSLIFKVDGRSQRFRIGAIASAFIVWFSTSLVVGRTGFGDSDAWAFISPFVSLSAALLVYVAFKPPKWLQARLHVQGFGERRDA